MKLIGNIILIFLFLLVFAGAEVFAQDQDGDNSDNPPDQTETAENDDAQSEESNDIIDLGVIYIEGTYLETDEIIDRPTAFATVLDPQELSRRSITLPEVLDSVPGVSVRSFGGLGALSTISIRGLGSENVLVTLDGVPLNPAGGSVDLSDIPLDSLERIEIIRGGEGAFHGGGAVGGIVRLTSLSIDERDGTQITGRISTGSFGTIISGFTWRDSNDLFHFELAGSRGDFDFLNDNGTFFDTGDDFTDTRVNNEFTAIETRYGHTWNLGDRRTLGISTEWYRSRKGIPGITTFPSRHASQADTRTFFQTTYFDPGFGDWNMDATFAWLRQSRHFLDEFGESTGVPLATSWIHNRYESTAKLTGAGFAGSDILTCGFSIAQESVDGTEYENSSRGTFAAWVRDEFYLPSNGVISGAVRCDRVDGDTILSPEIGLKYPISDSWTARTNFGLDFRSPSFEELYRNEGFVIGNPDLVNERTLGFDIGITHTENRIRFEAVYFNLQTRDLIDYLLISGFRWKPFNIGRVRSSGFEFSTDWVINRELELRASYTRTRAVDISGDPTHAGMPLVGQPSSEIFTELRWHRNNWEAFCNWERRGVIPVTPSGTRFLAPDESMGIGLGYDFNSGTSLMFEIKNLLDNHLTDVRGFPLPGRAYFLTVKGEF